MSADAEEEARKRIMDALEEPTVKITVHKSGEPKKTWHVPSALLKEQTHFFHSEYLDRKPEDPEGGDSDYQEDKDSGCDENHDSDCHEDNDSESFEISIEDVRPAAVKLFIYFMCFGCLPEDALVSTQIELCILAYEFGEEYKAIKFKNCVMGHLYKTFSLSGATWKCFSLSEFSKYYRCTTRGSRVRRFLEIMGVEHFTMTEYMQNSRYRDSWVTLVVKVITKHHIVHNLLHEHRANYIGETSKEVLALPLETFLDRGLPWEVED